MTFGKTIPDRRSARRAATIAEILAAAWALARTQGLAALTLRDVAKAVGMQAPSLYGYFDSKAAIYDAMFADGYRQLLDLRAQLPAPATVAEFKDGCRRWFTFAVEDPARYQLLFQRTIPGFEPSEASMALARQALGWAEQALAGIGVDDPRALDLYTALLTGLSDQQISNDPGGERWARLLDDALDMYLAHVRPTERKKKRP